MNGVTDGSQLEENEQLEDKDEQKQHGRKRNPSVKAKRLSSSKMSSMKREGSQRKRPRQWAARQKEEKR